MKKLIMCSLLLCCIMFFVAGSAFAAKPTNNDGVYIGNGFPSGPHFNLNIHGKDPSVFLDSDCPVVFEYKGITAVWKWDDVLDDWKLDTSIFTPEYSDPGESNPVTERILVQSGKTKGKKKSGTVTIGNYLTVTDPCTEGIDGSSAVFQLPPCEAGYRVYGRALGKPSENVDNRTITLSSGEILTAEDENGNNLLELGTITENSYTKTNSTQLFIRGKGQPVTIPLTDLFTFDGTLCYFTDPGGTTPVTLCCKIERDSDGNPTGEYTNCDELMEDGSCPVDDQEQVTVYCKDYDNVWIFGIADFVEYYFGVANDGVKLLQIRFYPIDPSCITSS